MRRLILFLSIPVLIYSCNNNKVIIKGKLENPRGSYIYLRELTLTGSGFTDSILLDKSGSFKFKLELTYPMFYTLQVSQNSELVTLLAKPGDRIKITGKTDNLLRSYQVTGSEESKNVQILTQRLYKTISCLDSLNNVYQQFMNNKNIDNIYKILTMSYDRCLQEQRQFSISFIRKNPASLACLMALYQQINSKTYVFDKEDDLSYFLSVDSALYKNYRETPNVKALHSNIEQMKEQKRVLQIQQMLSIMGAKAPELALPSPNGDTIRLSSFKGKVILIYFWASWNEECLKENVNLVGLYNKYKSKGFEIYQVSIDKTKEPWLKAIKENGLKWAQVCDLKYWQSPAVKLYNFEKVPTTYLIDKTGVIISRDLKGEDLKNKLAEIFE